MLKVINEVVTFLGVRISKKATRLLRIGTKESTINSHDIQTAVRSLLPGKLAKHAVSEGTKAVTKFVTSFPTSKEDIKKGEKKRTMASRSGLQFPPARAKNLLKEVSGGKNISKTAPVYLAAVMEYIAAEILELSGNAARDNKRSQLTVRHFHMAINGDEELPLLFSRLLGDGWTAFGNDSFHVPPLSTTKQKREVKRLRGEIKSDQPSALLGAHDPFEHVVRTIVRQLSSPQREGSIRLGTGVARYIQSIVEDIAVRLLGKAYKVAVEVGKRKTLQINDFIGLRRSDELDSNGVVAENAEPSPVEMSKDATGGRLCAPFIRRLAFRAGVEALSREVYNYIRQVMWYEISRIVQECLYFNENSRTLTITIGEVFLASGKKYLHPGVTDDFLLA